MLPPVKKSMPYHIKVHQHICLELVLTAFTWKWCSISIYDLDFHQRNNVIDRRCIFSQKQQFGVLNLLLIDLLFYNHAAFFHKMLIDVLEMRGLLVDYCNVFINSLVSYSNDTHSLQRSHW